ncbi:guanylate cyclase [Sphingomonas lacunae]|uniref:Guanylate cyclase n=1 Tax=Sphingomonas lacunae TaxID=2698828 RepID=A0A6M4AQ00_9SPHN|nr:heme NO-binding domain-containing protein [Sphingomonas lacunae]QJQ31144.1 guanylate cyclase [Sphingomonas lacunae]
MKGIIFAELVRFMEETQSAAFADSVIRAADIPSDGAYGAANNYPSSEALKLVATASEHSGVPQDELCVLFGHYLFRRFTLLYSYLIEAYETAEDLLMHIGSHIHADVCVLYPDARPPQVSLVKLSDQTIVTYSSYRPMAMIALGLVQQCMVHFGDPRQVTCEVTNKGRQATFVLVEPDQEAAA